MRGPGFCELLARLPPAEVQRKAGSPIVQTGEGGKTSASAPVDGARGSLHGLTSLTGSSSQRYLLEELALDPTQGREVKARPAALGASGPSASAREESLVRRPQLLPPQDRASGRAALRPHQASRLPGAHSPAHQLPALLPRRPAARHASPGPPLAGRAAAAGPVPRARSPEPRRCAGRRAHPRVRRGPRPAARWPGSPAALRPAARRTGAVPQHGLPAQQ